MPAGLSDSLKVMIVEDEAVIALDLAGMMEDLGHVVVKIASRLDIGIEFAGSGQLDLAILDMNVHGVLSFPIALILRDRGIPFIFASGYGQRGLIDGFRDAHVLTKPYSMETLVEMVTTVMH